MSDSSSYFYSVVAETLRRYRLTDKPEVIRELATHIEDHYDALLALGVDSEQARERALAEVGDPEALCSRIQRARGEDMLSSVRRILICGTASVAVGSACNWALMRAGFRPYVIWLQQDVFVCIPMIPLILAFAAGGALAAALVRQQRGSRREQLLAAASPMLLMVILFVSGAGIYTACLSLAHQSFPTLSSVWLMAGSIVTTQLLLPCLSSCVGAAIFLAATRRATSTECSA